MIVTVMLGPRESVVYNLSLNESQAAEADLNNQKDHDGISGPKDTSRVPKDQPKTPYTVRC